MKNLLVIIIFVAVLSVSIPNHAQSAPVWPKPDLPSPVEILETNLGRLVALIQSNGGELQKDRCKNDWTQVRFKDGSSIGILSPQGETEYVEYDFMQTEKQIKMGELLPYLRANTKVLTRTFLPKKGEERLGEQPAIVALWGKGKYYWEVNAYLDSNNEKDWKNGRVIVLRVGSRLLEE